MRGSLPAIESILPYRILKPSGSKVQLIQLSLETFHDGGITTNRT